MDPHLIDLLWEVHREVGAKEPIWIVCGYRSPATNSASAPALERSRPAQPAHARQGDRLLHSRRTARSDCAPPACAPQRGGVGYLPDSGAPFVHMDTGSVRHWPRMPEEQLATRDGEGAAPLAARALERRRRDGSRSAAVSREPRCSRSCSAAARTRNEETTAAPAAARSGCAREAGRRDGAKPRPRRRKPAKPETAKPETYQVAAAASTPVA